MTKRFPILAIRSWSDLKVFLRHWTQTSEGGYLLMLSVVVGLLMGVVSTIFRWVLLQSHEFFFGDDASLFRFKDFGAHRGEVLLQAALPAIGGLVVGLLIYKLLHLRGGHGVPSVMKAVATGQINLQPSMAIKSATSPLTIASGGSAGPEGPIIEIGSVVGSLVGTRGHVRKEQVGTLIGCGSAAGLAAVFNAPIGGVIFSLELIMRDFNVRKFAPVVVAAVVASVVSSALMPNDPAFEQLSRNSLETIQPSLLLVLQFAVLGVICGIVGALLTTALYWMHDVFSAIKVPLWAKPAIGGLLVGIIGLQAPGVLGEGYETVNKLVLASSSRPEIVRTVVLSLILICGLKIVATSLTLGSGGTGGSFAPAMIAGAFLGGAFGLVVDKMMPTWSPDFRVFAMVGMAGVVSSAIGTPLAAMLILYEVAGAHYQLVLPLMITVAISSLVTSSLRKGSVYTLSLLRDGFDVEETSVRRDPLLRIPIGDIMKKEFVNLRQENTLDHILDLLGSTDDDAFVVTNSKGVLQGIVSTTDLRTVLNLGELGEAVLIAQDVADPNPPYLLPDSPASQAIEIFGSSDSEGIAIVNNLEERRVVGVVYRGQVLKAYRKVIRE
ncbi:chloride channel protein [bacterium]|nr:chloride channel protein [bacterium]